VCRSTSSFGWPRHTRRQSRTAPRSTSRSCRARSSTNWPNMARSRGPAPLIGLAVRAGAPMPDIGSVAALTRALLQARSFAYSDGSSGAYTAALLGKLGIAEQMRPKTKLTSGPGAELVARGEAEIGIQQIVAIAHQGSAIGRPAAGRTAKCHRLRRRLGTAPAILLWRVTLSRLWRRTRRSGVRPRARLDRGERAFAQMTGNACAIALLCPYLLDLGPERRYIPPTFRQVVSFASRNGLPGPE
jgi:extracellular solute-binding protein